jgi:curved DNA-binding protein CbpA
VTHIEDLYEVLGVKPDATPEEIRAARNRRAMDLHPDRLAQAAEDERRAAEEELIRVNQAYEVLSDPATRAEYDRQRRQASSPPVPVIHPAVISFLDVEPHEQCLASFVVDNAGGPYSDISISVAGTLVTVIGYESTGSDDELPMRIDIAASGTERGRFYMDEVAVRLDGVETRVRVRLTTRPAAAPGTASRPVPPQAPVPQPRVSGAAAFGIAVAAAIVIGIVAVIASGAGEQGLPRTGSQSYRSNSGWTPPYQPPATSSTRQSGTYDPFQQLTGNSGRSGAYDPWQNPMGQTSPVMSTADRINAQNQALISGKGLTGIQQATQPRNTSPQVGGYQGYSGGNQGTTTRGGSSFGGSSGGSSRGSGSFGGGSFGGGTGGIWGR